jgi:glutathionyl-hydroquinone reductase
MTNDTNDETKSDEILDKINNIFDDFRDKILKYVPTEYQIKVKYLIGDLEFELAKTMEL